MMRAICVLLFTLGAPGIALADAVIAQRTIPAQTIIVEADLVLVDAQIDGALDAAALAIGKETRSTIYAGRPLRAADLVSAAMVDRNQTVDLVFHSAGLTILAEGRALQRGAEGDTIRALNIASKITVSGRVGPDGKIHVGDRN